VLAGDIDLTTHAVLAAALAGAADSDSQLHLDLAGVRFCDGAGMRILLRGSQRKPQACRTVLHNLPPHLDKLRHLLEGDPAQDRTADDRGARPRAGTADQPAASPPAVGAGQRWSPGQEIQSVPAPARPGHRRAEDRRRRRADA
jgi:anti-anti-sigma regulatory factor